MSKIKGSPTLEHIYPTPDAFFINYSNEIYDCGGVEVTYTFLWRVEAYRGSFRALCENRFYTKDLGLAGRRKSSWGWKSVGSAEHAQV